MRKVLSVLAVLSLVFGMSGSISIPSAHAEPDFPVPGGYFYTEASPQGAAGYGFRLTDEGGIPFYTTYMNLGGPSVLGYPITRRFMWQGFIHQATQKAIFQWQPQPGGGQLAFVNIFDEMTKAGKDKWLSVVRSTPQPISSVTASEGGQSIDVISSSRLSFLDARPAIRNKYYAVAGAIDPVLLYGLPTSKVEDMGSNYTIRLQRAVIQEWKQDTPWAKAGEATVANGGDIALEAGMFPPGALVPELPPTTDVPDLPALTPQAQQVADAARPAVVKMTLRNGDFGSGMIFDPNGLILTNAHVVESASKVMVQLIDGRFFDGQVLGRDPVADVALVRIDAQGLPTVKLGNSDAVQAGDTVVAIGYTAIVPGAPSSRIGIVRDLVSNSPPMGGSRQYDAIGSDTFIHPGDSGGPLLNLQGEVVGMNASITFTDSPRRILEASSLAINAVRAAASRLR